MRIPIQTAQDIPLDRLETLKDFDLMNDESLLDEQTPLYQREESKTADADMLQDPFDFDESGDNMLI